jgi:hypothetical protein
MSFRIPEKQMIVHSDDQVRLLNDDDPATVYQDADVAAGTDGFILEGFHTNPILVNDMPNQVVWKNGNPKTFKIATEAAVAAAAQVVDYQVDAIGAVVGDSFRIVFESLDGSPTDFQNQPVSKIYQLSATAPLTTVDEIAAAMNAAINADDNPLCTSSVLTDTLTLTGVDVGVKFTVRVDPVLSGILGTQAADTTAASVSLHDYEYLKNVDWTRNIDIDRNEEYYPRKGVTYKMYKFQVNSQGFRSEGNNVPNVAVPTSTTTFKLWVAASASTFLAAMDLLADDANPLT